MTGVNILIACVAMLGFLPLIVFLYGKKRASHILANGRTVRATVFHVATGYKGNYETVHYYFIANDGREYKGYFKTHPGLHRVNGSIEVHYLPGNPNQNTVKGTWNTNWFLLFVLLIAIAVLYMMYKLYQMVNS